MAMGRMVTLWVDKLKSSCLNCCQIIWWEIRTLKILQTDSILACQGTLETPLRLCMMNWSDHKCLIAIFQAQQSVQFFLTLKGFFVPTQVTVEQCFTHRERKEGSKWLHYRRIINQACQKKKRELNKWMVACVQFRGHKDIGLDLTVSGVSKRTHQDLQWVVVWVMGSPTLSAWYVSQVRLFDLTIFRGKVIDSRTLRQIHYNCQWRRLGISV